MCSLQHLQRTTMGSGNLPYSQRVPSQQLRILNIKMFSEEVVLQRAANAWKPTSMKAVKGQDSTEELLRCFRGLLNKLTPEKFEQLVEKLQKLPIDTEEKLRGVVGLTVEKAIDEPHFSSTYAKMCHRFAGVEVQSVDGAQLTFRKLLLHRCKGEFYEEANQKRSLGNVKFIGELFNEGIFSEERVHKCIRKLLGQRSKESLECLCKLLSTAGKKLDVPNAKLKMDVWFDMMVNIVKENTWARIRFLVLDVVELRTNNWMPRRGHQGPKPIAEIHEEAQQEEQREQKKLRERREQMKNVAFTLSDKLEEATNKVDAAEVTKQLEVTPCSPVLPVSPPPSPDMKVVRRFAGQEVLQREEPEQRWLKTVLEVQYVLGQLRQESVRQDLKQCDAAGSSLLTDADLSSLDDFYKLVGPDRNFKLRLTDQYKEASIHLWDLVEGRDKAVVGTTYKSLKDTLDKVLMSGYFDRAQTPQNRTFEKQEEPTVGAESPAAEQQPETREVSMLAFAGQALDPVIVSAQPVKPVQSVDLQQMDGAFPQERLQSVVGGFWRPQQGMSSAGGHEKPSPAAGFGGLTGQSLYTSRTVPKGGPRKARGVINADQGSNRIREGYELYRPAFSSSPRCGYNENQYNTSRDYSRSTNQRAGYRPVYNRGAAQ